MKKIKKELQQQGKGNDTVNGDGKALKLKK